jgi:hypothetical protein
LIDMRSIHCVLALGLSVFDRGGGSNDLCPYVMAHRYSKPAKRAILNNSIHR